MQARMCSTSEDMQYKRGYAVQARICSTSEDVQYKRGCVLQARMCSTSKDVHRSKAYYQMWEKEHHSKDIFE